MARTKRVIVHIEAGLHLALRAKAARTDASIAELVNAAVRQSLTEDAEDLAVFRDRANDPRIAFDRSALFSADAVLAGKSNRK